MNYGIIAAGEGSRLLQEGVKQPKPLVSLGGEPMLGRLIRLFLKNGAESVSIIVNEEMTSVHDYLAALSLPVPLHLVKKSTPSSMHSFHALSPFLSKGKSCLTTVDTIFKEEEFSKYIAAFEAENDCDCLFAVTSFIEDEKPLYVEVDAENRITGFLDADPHPHFVSGGVYCFNAGRSFQVLENCLSAGKHRMRNYQRELIADGLTVKAFPFDKIVDVDHADDIRRAEYFLLHE